jgi:Na+-translocating ferredoxin:NAD+ oxidoreductase RnfG subunit
MSSDPAERGRRHPAAALASLILVLLPCAHAAARVQLTQEEALALAFPEARVERESVFLSDEQAARAAELAEWEMKKKLVVAYRAWRDGKLVGTAYFDTHIVRSLPETLMVVVAPDGRVRRVEVLAFSEPPEYQPREPWYAQFSGQRLDQGLKLKRNIRAVTGATLTARATLEAVRRVLALHRVIEQRGPLAEDNLKPVKEAP